MSTYDEYVENYGEDNARLGWDYLLDGDQNGSWAGTSSIGTSVTNPFIHSANSTIPACSDGILAGREAPDKRLPKISVDRWTARCAH